MSTQPSRVGVEYVITAQSSPALSNTVSARAQFVGITAKGPLNYGQPVGSYDQFVRLFGGRAPFETLSTDVKLFFEEQGGAGEIYVTRVVGDAATNGSVTLQDGATTPADTLTVETTEPGSHSSDYAVIVSTATTGGVTLTVVEQTTGRVLAAFDGTTPAELVERSLGNANVVIRSLGNENLPAAGTFPLSGGTDDRDTVTSTHYVAALDAHKSVPAGVAVLVPGQSPANVASGVAAHCHNRHKVALLDVPKGSSIDQAKAIGDDLLGDPYMQYVGVFYPHLRTQDNWVAGASAYAAAARATTHRTKSPAAAPAGAARKTTAVSAPLVALDEDDINNLNTSRVNGVLSEGGRHYLYNYVTPSSDAALFNLNDTDAANAIASSLDSAFRSDEILFEPNGRPELLTRIRGHIETVLNRYYEDGYLQPRLDADGNVIDTGYVASIENVVESSQGAPYDQLHVQLDVRFRPTLRHISMSVRRLEFRYNLTAGAGA